VWERREGIQDVSLSGYFAVIYKLTIIKFHLIRNQLCEVEISGI
jgi:hypothetical protein